MRIELRPDARAEMWAATLWYEARRFGLGSEFFEEVSVAIERASEAPDRFPKWLDVPGKVLIRKVAVHRFPYLIALQMCDQYALVLAVSHVKRRQLYWLSRREI